MGSIFDQIGGEDAVGAAVDIFYDKVLDDPTLARYLDGVDMQRLREHQREFMTAALGGPDEYLGRSMRAAHSGLGITDAAFDAVIGHHAQGARRLPSNLWRSRRYALTAAGRDRDGRPLSRPQGTTAHQHRWCPRRGAGWRWGTAARNDIRVEGASG